MKTLHTRLTSVWIIITTHVIISIKWINTTMWRTDGQETDTPIDRTPVYADSRQSARPTALSRTFKIWIKIQMPMILKFYYLKTQWIVSAKDTLALTSQHGHCGGFAGSVAA